VSEDGQKAAAALAEARKGHNGWFRANCPFCVDLTGKADKRQSLGIKPSIEFFQCFKCGTRGRLPEQEDLFQPVVEEIKTPVAEDIKIIREAFEPLWTDDSWNSIFLETPVGYLKGRGVSREIVRDAQIGAALSGWFAGRVVVPVLDLDERTWLGFSARDWTDKQKLRYRYPRGMERAKFLYNQVALYRESDHPVMIVEGVFDALPYWPDAVACLGKPGELHTRLLCEEDVKRPIAVCLDGDAWEEGWALSEVLKLYGRQAGYVRLPPCMDPNTVDKVWLKEEVKRCIRY
jgi:hypothetical protein